MNCRNFETIVNELASNSLMEAVMRESGLAHAATCKGCAARLFDEQQLAATLRLAGIAETEQAPLRVKQALMAAFAGRGAVTPQPARILAWNTRTLRRWVWAIAAAIILMLTIPVLHLLRRQTPTPQLEARSTEQPTARADAVKSHESKPDAPLLSTGKPEAQQPLVLKTVSIRKRPAVRPLRENVNGSSAVRERESSAKNVETVTDFIPLTYSVDSTRLEGGQMVRVLIQRSALISLGLPMNGERAEELVKADLIVGDDGVARAVRLVQRSNER